ncbi:hypothetical protein L2744_00320 [Shewanella profunda]|uniref:hypothetical protein n=1 Tax=Shewanella profunda TaxID=254793 RepID=UPI00200F440D|nr:hypothetical protein [Shewanella profunda]MCL1088077.1 hypothetical protein [Shewanella profunda]
MNSIINIVTQKIGVIPVGLIAVDMDSAAERLVISDRLQLLPINIVTRPSSGIAKILVPQIYTISNSLIVGILDDSGVYDCKFVDGVMAELVDANTVDMSQ